MRKGVKYLADVYKRSNTYKYLRRKEKEETQLS